MTIIPVIDLLHGVAVLARHGRREDYRPIDSPLCPQGRVLPLVERFIDRFGFSILYLADLDAIQGHGTNSGVIEQIARLYPELQLWIDAGYRGPADLEPVLHRPHFRPVVGTETWAAPGNMPHRGCIVSIDLDTDGIRDPAGLAVDTSQLPPDLILMNLARVGSDSGPDIALLRRFAAQTSADSRLFIAGGVRGRDDLEAARTAGAAGILLASALHTGRITPGDLHGFS